MRHASLVHRSHSSPSKSEYNNGASLNHPANDEAPSDKNKKSGMFRGIFIQPLFIAAIVMWLLYVMFSKNDNIHWNDDSPTITRVMRNHGPRPLMVQMLGSTQQVQTLALQQQQQQQQQPLIHNRRNRYWINHFSEDSDLSYDNMRKQWPKEHCEILGDWMLREACNCNTFHELTMTEFYDRDTDYSHLEYIKDGGFRIAWKTAEYDGTPRVLKTLKYLDKRNFDWDNLERHGRDAIAIEQLMASPYIADIYGHCAQSALVDYSDEVSLYHIFHDEDVLPSFDQLFQISYDAVAAVADTHHLNEDDRATIAHMDIKPNQWIYLNDRYQLNDYNLGKFVMLCRVLVSCTLTVLTHYTHSKVSHMEYRGETVLWTH